ncbi:MAG: TonB-dependent receptor plug domain-containing protein, partial [Gammaproteobacteria bacterium]
MQGASGHTDFHRARSRSAAWLIAALLSLPGLAWPQIDEIVVSVRKKAENLQDVPMAVTAFGEEVIERQGIRSVTDVARNTTSIQFDESFAKSDTRIVVRGLSPTRGRQNAAILVDGIDVSSEAITSSGGSLLVNTRLIDIQRIEVVLGPQMALYGRSAFNGALQYITKDPSAELEAEFKADFNHQDGYELVGTLSGPILDDALGFRINATAWEQDGFYRNSITGAQIGGEEGYGVALTLKSEVDDNLSFKFRAEFTDDEAQPSAQAFLRFNTELDVPQGAFDTGIAECTGGVIAALSDWNNPNPVIPAQGQGVPGNNQAWLDRGLRILDPAYVATLDPATLDPTSQNFIIPAGRGGYCEGVPNNTTDPDLLRLDPTRGDVPVRVGQIPDADELTIAIAPDPLTPGKDYAGFDRELLRLSLVSEWASERFTIVSLTGFTSDENTETQDTNVFAFRDPAAGAFLDGNVNSFSFNNAKQTEQFSQDLRFTTTLDGPVNGTIGALYWTEDVDNRSNSVTAQASGTHCFWNSLSGDRDPVQAADGCTGYTETPVAPYQAAAAPFRPPSAADRETDHWSIYGTLDFEIAE